MDFYNNVKKTSVIVHSGPTRPVLTVFGQNGRNGCFFKKVLGTFFPPFWVITNCKVSKKSNEQISRYFRTHGRTNGRGLNSRFLRINIQWTKNTPIKRCASELVRTQEFRGWLISFEQQLEPQPQTEIFIKESYARTLCSISWGW